MSCGTTRPATRIEFEHRDGLYWLDCKAVERTASVLGLRCQGDANGFDATLAYLYMRRLLDKRFAVFVRKGEEVSKLSLPRRHSDDQTKSTPLLLSPDLILGRRYLQQLSCLAAKSRSFLAAVGAMERRLLSGEDVGEPVVYQVAADMYEVDWTLTLLTERASEALALAAYRLERPLACRLVLPQPRRGKDGEPPLRPASRKQTCHVRAAEARHLMGNLKCAEPQAPGDWHRHACSPNCYEDAEVVLVMPATYEDGPRTSAKPLPAIGAVSIKC